MRVLAICRPSEEADMDRFALLVPDEGRVLRQLKASGTITDAWSPGRAGAILILAVDDLDGATGVINQLPLAEAGLITTELIPLYDIGL